MGSQTPQEKPGYYKDTLMNEWRVFLPIEENPYLKPGSVIPSINGDFPPPIKKPTLGVMPRRIWLHQRAVALTQAINRYTTDAGYASAYELIDELDEILEELKIPQQAQND